MTRTLLWKLAILLLVVSAVPLLAGVVIVDQLLKDTIALGLDQRVGDHLDHAATVYRGHIVLSKKLIVLETEALARDPELAQKLAGGDNAELDAWLSERAHGLSSDQFGVSRVVVLDAEGTQVTEVDRRDEYPEDAWRAKDTVVAVTASDGTPYQLALTWVVPWALFHHYQQLGEVARLFDNLAQRQTALTEGYTRTYYATAGLVLLFTLVLSVLVANAFTGRIRLLARATAQVGRGNLDVRVPVAGRDEVAQLTRDFNAMVQDLEQARDRLNYLERVSAWQEIARRLAHEIKNPLTPILLAVQQLDRKFEDYRRDPDRYRRLVSDAMEIVSEEVEGLRRLVAEFSEFARLPRVEPEPTDMSAFLRDLLRTNPQYEDVIAQADLGGGGAYRVELDAGLMKRVFINLLDNSCEASREADTTPDIQIRVEHGGSDVVVVVEDSGPGIAPENLALLFDPYFTTKTEGTGLGLSIVKKIVLEHGGDIEVESPSQGDRGARFVIRLPAMPSRDS